MKIRMQIGGFEVKLSGPVEALAQVAAACEGAARVYDRDYEPLEFTKLRVSDRGGVRIITYDGPVMAMRVSELENTCQRVTAYNASIEKARKGVA